VNDEKLRHVRACVAFAVCASMIFGMFFLGTGYGQAAADNAVFKGQVKIGTDPAPDTLVMYSVGAQESPSGNSTVSDLAGDYEIWVEGGQSYYLYYANGAAMFDSNAQVPSAIAPGEVKYVNVTLTPAPARTVTLKGHLTNASNASQPVTGGHLLGFMMTGEGNPDYINWTKPNSTGYYEVTVIPGPVMVAIFDAPGYFPAMAPSSPPNAAPGDTVWINVSLRPFTGYTVNVTGYVRDAMSPVAIQGALVRAFLQDVGWSTTNTTNASGFYKVQLVDGRGGLEVMAPNYVSQRHEPVDFAGNMSYDFNLNKQDAKIHGFVLDASTRQPIPNASVWADHYLGSDLRQYNQTISGSDGSYNMSLCGGSWRVAAGAAGYGDRGDDVALLSGETVLHNITLPRESGRICGFLTEWQTGFPIDNATVMIGGEGSYDRNSTSTNATGYFSINCLPDNYNITFVAADYMWEVSSTYIVAVGPNETVWVNHSLDPATVKLFGAVKDAVTLGPIDGATISAFSPSPHSPDYFRVTIGASVGGNYSMMVAYDDSFTMIRAEHPAYQTVQSLTSIPSGPLFEHNITMIPTGVSTYTLQGLVADSSTDVPIASAAVKALYGETLVKNATTNSTGYYAMDLPVVELTIRASASGYLPSESVIAPGAAGSVVWQNITLDSHLEPPILNESVVPNNSVSIHNPANVSLDVVEPYLNYVTLILSKVTEKTNNYAWVQSIEDYNSQLTFGQILGDLLGAEVSPGHWSIWMPDWDTTSANLVLLSDGTGTWEASASSVYYPGSQETSILGYYNNASLMFPLPFRQAVFDSAGTFLGIAMGLGGPDPWTASDPTGEFWIQAQHIQFNLTDGRVMSAFWGDTDHLNASTMHLDRPTVTYPSGEYAAIFSASDIAENSNYTFALLTVDNDPPLADAGPDQTEIVGLAVSLNASASTDNGVLVNYTWSVEDGTSKTLWGETVDYTFTTVGNHTVTVTVRDAAGYSSSASTWVEVTPDELPVAAAGPDQVVDEDTTVDFNGTGSTDDIGIVNYTWTIVGPNIDLFGATPSHIFSTPGIYHVRLVVRDTAGQSSVYDEVVVAVLDVTAPSANAGLDQTVNVGTVATFDGSGSSDNTAVTQYTWTFTDGTLKTLTGMHPTYTFATGGDYTVTLTARDAEGNSDTDTVVIHVNTAPQANAGMDREVEQGAEVTFDGSGCADDYEIMNYTWTFTYGGTVHHLYGVAPKFTFDESGTYDVQLTIRDVGGLTNTDTVVVTVTGAGATSFLTQYWWALALVVVVVVIAAIVLLARKGKGPSPKMSGEQGEAPPPPPSESDELEFPPPNDEEL